MNKINSTMIREYHCLIEKEWENRTKNEKGMGKHRGVSAGKSERIARPFIMADCIMYYERRGPLKHSNHYFIEN